jgi:xanthine dehydrogenase/oxidase
MQSGYESTGWKVAPGKVSTNTVSNTYCRSPGSTQGFAVIETIMEHIAATLKKDPLEVRLVNFIKDGDKLLGDPAIVLADPSSEDYQELLKNPQDKFQGENYILRMVDELKISGELEERKKFIATFNQQNRWRKRGLGIVPMRYPVHYFSFAFPAYVAILQADASVVVSHGGIEMGQGINTKVAQVVAKTLNIPLDRVRVKASNNLVNPNSMTSGGAITSEVVCHAAMQSCNTLIARMAPVKEKMKTPTWEGLITACHSQGIDLRAHHFPSAKDDIKSYSVWGLNAIETEVDVLTGEFKIVRCDLIEDAGKSLSQEVDVGQIEGALVMGLGLWTSEKLQYNETTGELLTHNTWEYKVPLAKDIPEDLRITLLKNAPNPYGVLRSKATGEPPLCMSVGILFALRNAIDSARQDAGNNDYYQMDGPVTPEDVLKLTLSTKDKFTL